MKVHGRTGIGVAALSSNSGSRDGYDCRRSMESRAAQAQAQAQSAARGRRVLVGEQARDVQVEASCHGVQLLRRLVGIAIDGGQARPQGHRL
jgi:hypothetical protein